MASPHIDIVSYNLHGLNQGRPFLLDLFTAHNIICVQEHWLCSKDFDLLSNLNSNFLVFGSFAVDSVLRNGILKGRPFGGLAIFINRLLAASCKLVHSDDRFICVSCGDVLIFNVYFPCFASSGNDLVLDDLLARIADVVGNSSCKFTVIGGDFNFEFTPSHSRWKEFSSFLTACNLVTTDSLVCDPKYTFCCSNGPAQSFIDHFVVSSNFFPSISSVKILDSGANLSDHLPIVLSVSGSGESLFAVGGASATALPIADVQALNWQGGNLSDYYNNTFVLLSQVVASCGDTDRVASQSACGVIEGLLDDIVNALKAADACIPRKRGGIAKFWWNDHLTDLKLEACRAFNLWRDSGRPPGGPLTLCMRKAKLAYKRAVRCRQAEVEGRISDRLSSALLSCRTNEFWKVWSARFRSVASPQVVGGCTSASSIADVFASHFAEVGIPNDRGVQAGHMAEFYGKLKLHAGPAMSQPLTVELVDSCVRSLKRGKASGLDGLSAEHILFAHPICTLLLTRLFNLMLRFSYVPGCFGLGVLIPLLKSRELDCSSCDNYRGITISSILSKLFESCILASLSGVLRSDELQFGFKTGYGCSDALGVLKSVVDFYAARGSTVTLCSLDISKAFDKVSHFKLFSKLLDRNVPSNIVLLLLCWYTKCFVAVRWGGSLSAPFRVMSGVRQGGVLSPTLFAIYIDELIGLLRTSRLGCCLNGRFVGCLMYADDIMLLSLSVSAMQCMLDICSVFVSSLDLRFNVRKSVALRIGCRFRRQCEPLLLSSAPLSWVDEVKYLGVYFKSGVKFMRSFEFVRRRFFTCFNWIYSKSYRSELVCVNLLKSMCIPILTYALEATCGSVSSLKALDRVIDMAVAKIFCVFDADSILCIRNIFGLRSLIDFCGSGRCNVRVALFLSH